MANTLLIGAIALLVLANIALTVWVALSPALSTTQKVLQGLIVWLIPIVGTVGVFLVHLSDAEPRRRRTPPPGDGSDPMPGGTQ